MEFVNTKPKEKYIYTFGFYNEVETMNIEKLAKNPHYRKDLEESSDNKRYVTIDKTDLRLVNPKHIEPKFAVYYLFKALDQSSILITNEKAIELIEDVLLIQRKHGLLPSNLSKQDEEYLKKYLYKPIQNKYEALLRNLEKEKHVNKVIIDIINMNNEDLDKYKIE